MTIDGSSDFRCSYLARGSSSKVRARQRIGWSTWLRETGGTAKQAFERLRAPAWPWAAKGHAKYETRPSSPFAAIALLLGRATQVALGGPAISVAVP